MSRPAPHWLFVALVVLAPAGVAAQGATPPGAPPGTAQAPSATPAAPTGTLPPQPAAPPGQAPPAATPPAQPPPAYPAPQYPPGYGPPPGYYYPPPSYYYPPPPGYAWGPPPRQKPQYPEDAAGQTTPFLDMLVAGVALDKRYDHFFTVGAQGGVYVASRVRIVGRVLLFTTEPDDDLGTYYGEGVIPSEYEPIASDPPVVVIGGVVGLAPVVRRNFIFAPGIGFHTTNASAYGSMLTLAMPFEWVTDDGARFGFEIDIGRGFGGKITGRCVAASCSQNEKEFDRPAAPAFLAAFELGWGFNHPKAKLPESSTVP